jgi:hypothetical protein
MDFVDARGHRPARARAVRRAGAAPRTSATPLRAILAKGGRLPEPGAPRRVELLLQALVLPAQAITFALEVTLPALGPRHLLTQRRDLPLLTVDDGIAIFGLEPACARHAGVMPQSNQKYNPKL